MSPWAQYAKERNSEDSIEYAWGFLTYRVINQVCEIYDIFVVPEERRSGKATQLANEITELALKAGCNILVGFIWPAGAGATASMQSLLYYGFKLHSNDGARIILTKEIGG